MSTGELLSIEPQELQFPFELRKQISCSLLLSNKTDSYIAFKVKTTNPKKYCVRPNTGVVSPRSTCDVIVTMQAQKEAPSDMQCKDKFLLQSVVAGPGATPKDITPEMFNKESGHNVEECKLRVLYVAPPRSTQHACTIKVQIKPRPGRIHQRDKMRLFTRQLQPSPEMKERVTAVERIVGYDFVDKTLLEEALTHPSSCRPNSYQRLELLGDSALNHTVTKYLFRDSRKFNEEEITNRRKDTVSNPYLARIGARLGLYDYLVRHNTPDLDDQVAKFTEGVIKGKDMTGSPGYKVLADVVESVAAAVYIDLNYDLDKLMKIFKPLLDLEKSDSMMKTKESDSMLGYIASLLYTLGAKAYSVIISLLVFCLRGIILLVIVCVLTKLIDCFAK